MAGAARVARKHGWAAFKTPWLFLDAMFSAVGGVLYPAIFKGIAPQAAMDYMPVLGWAGVVAFMTYWLNGWLINRIKKITGSEGQADDGPNGNGETKK